MSSCSAENRRSFRPKEHAAGLPAGDVCRKYGNSEATLYKWRSRYGGKEISDARKLKALEDENRRLKKLVPPLVAVRLIKVLGHAQRLHKKLVGK